MAALVEFVQQYWELFSSVGGLLVFLVAAGAARRGWKRRQFLHRVNFSLNYVENGVLRIRTLQEAGIDDILLNNRHGKERLLRVARQARLDQPFLMLPGEDHWLVLNSVLNELSEQFAAGVLARSMGLPAKTATYVFGITCERDKDVRINKIRVMIVERSLLERIDEQTQFEFERPWHHVRLKTLKRMRRLYDEDKRCNAAEQAGDTPHAMRLASRGRQNLMEVELAVPLGAED